MWGLLVGNCLQSCVLGSTPALMCICEFVELTVPSSFNRMIHMIAMKSPDIFFMGTLDAWSELKCRCTTYV